MADAWNPGPIEACRWGGLVAGARVNRLYAKTRVEGVDALTPADIRKAGVRAATARTVIAAMTRGFWRPADMGNVVAAGDGDLEVARAAVIDGAVANVPTVVHVLIEAAQEGADCLVLASSSAHDAALIVAEALNDNRIVATTNSGPAKACQLLEVVKIVAPGAGEICGSSDSIEGPTRRVVPLPIRKAKWAVVTHKTVTRAAHPQELSALNAARLGVDVTGLVASKNPAGLEPGENTAVGVPLNLHKDVERALGRVEKYFDTIEEVSEETPPKEYQLIWMGDQTWSDESNPEQGASQHVDLIRPGGMVVFSLGSDDYPTVAVKARRVGCSVTTLKIQGQLYIVATKLREADRYILKARKITKTDGFSWFISAPGAGLLEVPRERSGALVWVDPQTKQTVPVYAHAGRVSAVAAGPGTLWCSGAEDGTVAVWNKTDHIATLDARGVDLPNKVWVDAYGPVTSIAMLASGFVIVVHQKGTRVWDRNYRYTDVEDEIFGGSGQNVLVVAGDGEYAFAVTHNQDKSLTLKAMTETALVNRTIYTREGIGSDRLFTRDLAVRGNNVVFAANTNENNDPLLVINGTEVKIIDSSIEIRAVDVNDTLAVALMKKSDDDDDTEPTQLWIYDTNTIPTEQDHSVLDLPESATVQSANHDADVAIVGSTVWYGGAATAIFGVTVQTPRSKISTVTETIAIGFTPRKIVAAGGGIVVA